MTKNRARKRATKALAKSADIRYPDAISDTDHRSLLIEEFGTLYFAKGPQRLIGDETTAKYFRADVIAAYAKQKNWTIIELDMVETADTPEVLASLKGKPSLVVIAGTSWPPRNPYALALAEGARPDLNVLVVREPLPGEDEDTIAETGHNIFFISARTREDWVEPDSSNHDPSSNQPFPEKVQLAPGVTGPGLTNALMRSFHEATFATGESVSTDDDPSPRVEAPFSLITGPPGTGRTAAGWARVDAADAAMDALRIPLEAQEFTTYPDGLFLITGPTYTGKTTTGLALMRRAQVDKGREAFAVMDPLEARGPRLGSATLLPVDGAGGPPAAIREAVERGAEILFVDGMYDRETIKAAVDASLSGVLVFATMHPRPEEALQRLQDEFQGDGATEIHERVRQAVRGVIGVQLVDGEGPERRALTAEVWVKGDGEEDSLEPVLTFAESRAAVTAKFAAIRAGSETGA